MAAETKTERAHSSSSPPPKAAGGHTTIRSGTLLQFNIGARRDYCAKCHLSAAKHCTKCGEFYCNAKCQSEHWNTHKASCGTAALRGALHEHILPYLYLFNRKLDLTAMRIQRSGIEEAMSELSAYMFECVRGPGNVVSAEGSDMGIVPSYHKLQARTRAIQATGCQKVWALPLVILGMWVKQELGRMVVLGNEVARLALLQNFSKAAYLEEHKQPLLVALSATVDVAFVQPEVPLPRLLVEDMNTYQRVVYIVNIDHAEEKGKAELQHKGAPKEVNLRDTDDVEKLADSFSYESWKTITSHPDNHDSHALAIVVNRRSGFLVQSYYGRYSDVSWLDFQHELNESSELPAPSSPHYPAWREIKAQPRYRGYLEPYQLHELGREICLLTTAADHRERLAEIIGIRYDKRLLSTSYKVRVQRVLI